MMKSHAIKALLQQPILFGRISQWLLQLSLLQLSRYDLKAGTSKAVKSQAIANLLAQFPGEEEFPLDDGVLEEVAAAIVAKEQWVMKFDGSSTINSRGVEVVLYHNGEETMSLLFKLEFLCSNITTESMRRCVGCIGLAVSL